MCVCVERERAYSVCGELLVPPVAGTVCDPWVLAVVGVHEAFFGCDSHVLRMLCLCCGERPNARSERLTTMLAVQGGEGVVPGAAAAGGAPPSAESLAAAEAAVAEQGALVRCVFSCRCPTPSNTERLHATPVPACKLLCGKWLEEIWLGRQRCVWCAWRTFDAPLVLLCLLPTLVVLVRVTPE